MSVKKYLKINGTKSKQTNGKFPKSLNETLVQTVNTFRAKNKIYIQNTSSVYYTDVSDGLNWHKLSLPSTSLSCFLVTEDGTLVCTLNRKASQNNFMFSKDNGMTWTYSQLPFDYPGKVFYGNEKYVVIHTQGDSSNLMVAVSTNGTTWTKTLDFRWSSGFGNGQYSNFVDGYFVLDRLRNGSYFYYYWSQDGISWTSVNRTNFNMLYPYRFQKVNGSYRDVYIEATYISDTGGWNERKANILHRITSNSITNASIASNSTRTIFQESNVGIDPYSSKSLNFYKNRSLCFAGLNDNWKGVYKINVDTLETTFLFKPNIPSGTQSIHPSNDSGIILIASSNTWGLFYLYWYLGNSQYIYKYYKWNYSNDEVTEISSLPNVGLRDPYLNI